MVYIGQFTRNLTIGDQRLVIGTCRGGQAVEREATKGGSKRLLKSPDRTRLHGGIERDRPFPLYFQLSTALLSRAALASVRSGTYAFGMEEPAEQMNESAGFRCPNCAEMIDISQAAPAQCPHCGADIVYPQDEDSEASTEDVTTDAEDELSSLHIRQISALRRGAYRARSYCIIGMGVLVVGAMQLLIMAAQRVRSSGWHLLEMGFVCAAIAALIFSWRLAGRVRALTHELRQPLLPEPSEPPDFSTLSDGSQQVRNLEKM